MASRYAGIDWASETRDVLVADEDGDEVLAATYAHDEKGLTALWRMLVRLEVVLVAVEKPDGLLVERAVFLSSRQSGRIFQPNVRGWWAVGSFASRGGREAPLRGALRASLSGCS